MVSAVYFDYGGVLALNGRPGMVTRSIGEYMGLDGPAEVFDLLDKIKVGALQDEAFYAAVNKRYESSLRRQIDSTIWEYGEIGDIFQQYPPMYELAQLIRSGGIPTGILSNVYPSTARLIRQKGFYDAFDPVILSCDKKYAKPDPLFYEIAEQAMGNVLPSEILLIDDQDKCIEAAQTRGWQTVQVGSDPQAAIVEVKTVLELV